MKYRVNTILALIPPNEDGKFILETSLFFQRKLNMRIFILNVIQPPTIIQRFQPKTIQVVRNAALRELYDFIEKVIPQYDPQKIILRVKAGKMVPVLLGESKAGGCEFIIVNKNEGALKKGQIDKIVSHSCCPVLTINKNSPPTKIKKIIIPIDISQSTKKRLLWATFFARQFGAKIEIVSALNIEMDETKSLAYRNANKIKKMLHDRGVECDIHILKIYKKEKTRAILDFIHEKNPDMVIIRTHQSAFSGAQIGRFVSTIVHECKMPVFTVARSKFPSQVGFEPQLQNESRLK